MLKKHPSLRKTRGRIGWRSRGRRARWRNIRVKPVGADYRFADAL